MEGLVLKRGGMPYI